MITSCTGTSHPTNPVNLSKLASLYVRDLKEFHVRLSKSRSHTFLFIIPFNFISAGQFQGALSRLFLQPDYFVLVSDATLPLIPFPGFRLYKDMKLVFQDQLDQKFWPNQINNCLLNINRKSEINALRGVLEQAAFHCHGKINKADLSLICKEAKKWVDVISASLDILVEEGECEEFVETMQVLLSEIKYQHEGDTPRLRDPYKCLRTPTQSSTDHNQGTHSRINSIFTFRRDSESNNNVSMLNEVRSPIQEFSPMGYQSKGAKFKSTGTDLSLAALDVLKKEIHLSQIESIILGEEADYIVAGFYQGFKINESQMADTLIEAYRELITPCNDQIVFSS